MLRLKFAIFLLLVCGSVLVQEIAIPERGSTHAAGGREFATFQPTIPQGIPVELWRRLIPPDNSVTAEKVALGETLFFDKRLSAQGTLSCATCHDPASGFADHNAIAIGVSDNQGTRNAPTVLNAMFNKRQFWDGRVRSLEEQAKQPILSPREMGMLNPVAVAARVSSIPEYQLRFRAVFKSEGISLDTIAKAIATYERTRLSGNSPFDRFNAGDADAITGAQKKGWELFKGKAQCIKCHTFTADSPFFTDFEFHNTGVATKNQNSEELMRRALRITGVPPQGALALHQSLAHINQFSELGRFLVTTNVKDLAAFKTPTLRDIELTTPYMHDGSEKTLLDVVRFYQHGGIANPNLDVLMFPLHLSDEEMDNLVEFMRALTSDDVLRQTQSARPQTRAPIALPSSQVR